MARRESTQASQESSAPDAPRRAFHGRRHGRRLRPGLKALLDDLLPRLRITLPDESARLDPAALFADAPGVAGFCLEIGFGSGEHLAWQAKRHPETGFLGAEYFVNGIASLLRRVRDGGLDNLRIYEGDGRDLLDVLPAATLDRVFILFPDPWPKARHHKRRVVQDETLDALARVMKDGAEVRLATDDMAYLRWMLERLVGRPDFEWLARGAGDWRERPPDWPATRYEEKAIQQGCRPAYLRFRRRPRGV